MKPILDLHRGPIYQLSMQGAGTCVPLSSAAPERNQYQLYDLGDPVDPATVFTEVTNVNL
jgi:hypothetical protein